MSSPSIIYHDEEKILSLRFKRGKSVDSDIEGNLVIDYDAKGAVVGIDIMNINLKNFVSVKQYQALAIQKR